MKKGIAAALCAVLTASGAVTAFAAEKLPDNAWERIQYVYDKTCHMPNNMKWSLAAVAAAVALTAVYYFAAIRKERGGGENEQ